MFFLAHLPKRERKDRKILNSTFNCGLRMITPTFVNFLSNCAAQLTDINY